MENDRYYQSNRNYTDVETGVEFALFVHRENHSYKLLVIKPNDLLAKYSEVNGWYLCAFTDAEIRLNTKRVIKLSVGQFYNLKDGEKVTHRKFTGFKKFTKI